MHIGRTPLIRLEKVVPDNGVEIWVKWEGANPTGSMKDRMALSMIQGAVARGQLNPGGRVVEYTGGSTGSSLAMVCAALGYQAHFVSSDAFAEEKLQTMRAFGARLDVLPSDGGKITPALIQSLIARARELSTEPNTVLDRSVQQPRQPGRLPRDGRARSLDALGGRLDEFVMMVGTSGCFSGNAVVLKEKRPRRALCRRRAGDEPALSRVGPVHRPSHRGHRAGLRAGQLPPRPRRRRRRRERRRRAMPRRGAWPARKASSAASRRAPTSGSRCSGPGRLPSGARIATMVCDSGLKYLRGDLYRS